MNPNGFHNSFHDLIENLLPAGIHPAILSLDQLADVMVQAGLSEADLHSIIADHAGTTLHEPLFGDYYGYPNKAAYDQAWKNWNEEQKAWNES
jgi:hypothetical protein